MEIKIIETGEEVELSITDPKSGCDWISDLMGNHDELPEIEEDEEGYDTGFRLMSQESFDWWKTLTVSLEKAEDRLHELEYDEDEKNEFIGNCDLEDLPSYINQFCDHCEEQKAKPEQYRVDCEKVFEFSAADNAYLFIGCLNGRSLERFLEEKENREDYDQMCDDDLYPRG